MQDPEGTLQSDQAQGNWRLLEDYPTPRPQAWVLKLVQAAVLGGASKVALRLLREEVIIDLPELRLPPARTLYDLLGDSRRHSNASLQAFKEALMSSKGAFWVDQGAQLGAFQARAPDYSFQPGQSKITGVQVRVPVDSAAQRAGLCHELRHYAFTCPIPLTLDTRRLDALQACASHGYGREQHPFFIGLARGGQPQFVLPPATFKGYVPQQKGPVRSKLRTRVPDPSAPVYAACLLSFFLAWVPLEAGFEWRLRQVPSQAYWVSNGVVVAQENLNIGGQLSVSAALFLSAEGLAFEADGLRLRPHKQRRGRLREVRRALREAVQEANLDLTRFVASYTAGGVAAGLSFLSLSAVSLTINPVLSVLSLAGGTYVTFTAGSKERSVNAELQQNLARLKRGWN